MIIDAHMHLTDPVELIIEQLAVCGIDKAVICSGALAKGEAVTDLMSAKQMMGGIEKAQLNASGNNTSRINKAVADAVAKYPNRLIGMGKVDLFQENTEGIIDEIVSLGLKGIGEIVGVHRHTDLLIPVLKGAHKYGLPVFIHTDYPVDAQDIDKLFDLAGKYYEARIILGHSGGDFWLETIERAKAYPNIWLDTSEIVNQTALKVAVAELPDRVLFSTDFPWDSVKSMMARIDALDMNHVEKSKVSGENAAALFCI